VGQLLAFSRKQVLEVRPTDLNTVIEGFERMLRRVIGEDVQVVLELGRPLASIRADHTQLEQVLMNLAVNARDAMPRGGRLTITTSECVLTPEYAARNPGMQAGPVVELTVRDTGVGMTADVLERLFEPFFTTKERGQGTGLGLATVYGVIKQHDGYILVESQPRAGATFRMFFPRVDEAAEHDAHAPATTLTGGDERVLVLEDDENVRVFVQAVLTTLGYRVSTAPDLDAALRLTAAEGTPDLLLVDVVLPQGSGKDAALRLAAGAPAVGVLFMSGYSNDVIAPHGVLAPGVHFLQKPFTPAVLAEKVREALPRRA
jgi:CheY-like chemotaxis protein